MNMGFSIIKAMFGTQSINFLYIEVDNDTIFWLCVRRHQRAEDKKNWMTMMDNSILMIAREYGASDFFTCQNAKV